MKLTRKIQYVRFAGVVALSAICALPIFADDAPALPANVTPAQLEGVGVEEHLERQIDLNLTFIAENGYPVRLADLFHKGRPVVLDLIYYSCPMLCNLVSTGRRPLPGNAVDAGQRIRSGHDQHRSGRILRPARRKRSRCICAPTGVRRRAGISWPTTKAMPSASRNKWDSSTVSTKQQQFAHAAAIMVLTPEGKMARYLYGVRSSPRDLKFALAEASEGRSTMAVQKILLYCYHYDPKAGGYVLFAENIMRAGGALTVFFIVFFLLRMFRAERRAAALKEGLAD